MNIANQVCTLEQAKRLKELGVIGNPLFRWYSDYDLVRGEHWSVGMMPLNTENPPAFTVAELGVMLPVCYTAVRQVVEGIAPKWWCQKYSVEDELIDFEEPHSIDGAIVSFPTEAQARAAMLIHLLENRLATADEVNQRLQKS